MDPVGWIHRAGRRRRLPLLDDYPHVEGGRNPLKRFEDSTRGISEAAKQKFYCDNFVDLMGNGMPAA